MKDENENSFPDFFENPDNWVLLKDTDGDRQFQISIDHNEGINNYSDFDGNIVCDKLNNLIGTINLPDDEIERIAISIVSGNTKIQQNNIKWGNGTWSLDNPQFLIGDNTIVAIALSKNGVISTDALHIWNTSYLNADLLDIDKND